jgi:hypothetical protein
MLNMKKEEGHAFPNNILDLKKTYFYRNIPVLKKYLCKGMSRR